MRQTISLLCSEPSHGSRHSQNKSQSQHHSPEAPVGLIDPWSNISGSSSAPQSILPPSAGLSRIRVPRGPHGLPSFPLCPGPPVVSPAHPHVGVETLPFSEACLSTASSASLLDSYSPSQRTKPLQVPSTSFWHQHEVGPGGGTHV